MNKLMAYKSEKAKAEPEMRYYPIIKWTQVNFYLGMHGLFPNG